MSYLITVGYDLDHLSLDDLSVDDISVHDLSCRSVDDLSVDDISVHNLADVCGIFFLPALTDPPMKTFGTDRWPVICWRASWIALPLSSWSSSINCRVGGGHRGYHITITERNGEDRVRDHTAKSAAAFTNLGELKKKNQLDVYARSMKKRILASWCSNNFSVEGRTLPFMHHSVREYSNRLGR